jgi:tRNA wybutosine-synthesizing protein 4
VVIQFLSLTNSVSTAKFCVLEQFLPDGPNNPFAKTMLEHFARQQAPIQSIMHYQSLNQHRKRFVDAGWKTVDASSLWDYWEDPSKLGAEEKLQLDDVEPFDEWEEFILFASHYFLLVAQRDPDMYSVPAESIIHDERLASFSRYGAKSDFIQVHANPLQDKLTTNRFGKAVTIGIDSVAVLGGIPDSSDVKIFASSLPPHIPRPPVSITVGHTLTNISADSFLLVGGRSSPSKPHSACFLYDGSKNEWTQVEDIQPARYRHCAVPIYIGSFRCVLVYGGRTSDGEVLGDWQLWLEGYGWYRLKVCFMGQPVSKRSECDLDSERFGAAMLATGGTSGILVGGLNRSKVLCNRIITWKLDLGQTDEISLKYSRPGTWGEIHLHTRNREWAPDFVSRARFGATLVNTGQGPWLIGGVGRTPNSAGCEIVSLHPSSNGHLSTVFANQESIRPLLVGASAITLSCGDVIISGGGAVCFSFGQYTDAHWYQIQTEFSSKCTRFSRYTKKDLDRSNESWEMVPKWSIHELKIEDSNEMQNLTSTSLEPWTMRSIDPGPCVNLWTMEYLESQIGPDTIVPIHHGTCRNLQFHPEKNFSYRTCPFSELKTQVESGAHVYLRSLASTSPFQKAANLYEDFPSIVQDFHVPDLLNDKFQLVEKIHSSVLRLSGNVAVWLHYDVMSNFLFQIHGSKTVILFPPASAVALLFDSGATTSSVSVADIEASVLRQENTLAPGVEGKAVTLYPGDVLFIPRFWLHATVPADNLSPASVAINIFWRDLDSKSYAAGRDVYGSRDLGAYENGRNAIKRIAERLKSENTGTSSLEHAKLLVNWLTTGKGKLDLKIKANADVERLRRKIVELPKDVGTFYLPRLADELLTLCVED